MRVIVNADDFGLCQETFAETVRCFEEGTLTSATIMVGMPATEAALAFARAHPELGFGVHLNLVATDGLERPLAEPSSIPALVTRDGRLLPTTTLRIRSLTGLLPVAQVEREIEAQIAYVRDAGVDLSHVDSHRHVHKLPAVREALRRVLPRFGIRRVRNVQDVYIRPPRVNATYWVGGVLRRRIAAAFVTTNHMYMPSTAHDVDWHDALLTRCGRLGDGTLEVGVHPGPDGWRAAERLSLVPFAGAARASGHELIAWRDVQ